MLQETVHLTSSFNTKSIGFRELAAGLIIISPLSVAISEMLYGTRQSQYSDTISALTPPPKEQASLIIRPRVADHQQQHFTFRWWCRLL